MERPGPDRRRLEAVVFDLWGTLVDDPRTVPGYAQMMQEVAGLLGVDHLEFARVWSATSAKRLIGIPPSTEAAHVNVCQELGVEPDPNRVRASVEVRYAHTRRALAAARPGSTETLAALKESGYKTGLISNCSEETSRLWGATLFAPLIDAAVLSFDVGLAKPDPRIYALAARRVGVAAERCLFVGDGSEGELTGAARAGMTAVLMRAPYDLEDDLVGGYREGWTGDRISAIPEVLDLLRHLP